MDEDDTASAVEPIDDIDRIGMAVGIYIARRWNQLHERMPEMPGGILASVAGYDIWTVMAMAESDPLAACDRFLEAEAVFAT